MKSPCKAQHLAGDFCGCLVLQFLELLETGKDVHIALVPFVNQRLER